MKQKRIIVLLFVLGLVLPSFAWGPKGHRIVAEVAYNHMSKKAIKQVDAILGTHGMIMWVNWPDEIKSDTVYPYSFNWHFQNLDGGLSDSAVVATMTDYPEEGGKLWRAVDSLQVELKRDRYNHDALVFFIHLIGDSYCPMHLAHADDRGGNKIKLMWFGAPTNLHRIWDENLIDSRGFSYTEYAKFLNDRFDKAHKNKPLPSRAEDAVVTYHIVEAIYAYQTLNDTNTYHYIYRFKNDMEWQLYEAGLRLASLLNEIYK